MNWKEFLKPDLKKMVLAIIIFAVSFYIYLSLSYVAISSFPIWRVCCDQFQRNETVEPFCTDLANRSGFIFNIENCNKYFAEQEKQSFYNQILWYVQIVLLAVFSYLISCFVVWISKRKKGKPE